MTGEFEMVTNKPKFAAAVLFLLTALLILSGCTQTKPDAPEFSLADGTYTGTQAVAIESGNKDDTIYYTADGSDPIENGDEYKGPLIIEKNCTLKAVVKDKNGNYSDIATAVYIIEQSPVVTEDTQSQTNQNSQSTQNTQSTQSSGGYTVNTSDDMLDYFSGRYQAADGTLVYFDSALKTDTPMLWIRQYANGESWGTSAYYRVDSVTSSRAVLSLYNLAGGGLPDWAESQRLVITPANLTTGSINVNGENLDFINNDPFN